MHWGVGGLWFWVDDGSGGGTGYVGVLSDEDLEEDERSICLGDYSSLNTYLLRPLQYIHTLERDLRQFKSTIIHTYTSTLN